MGATEERYRQLHPKSAELHSKAAKLFPNGVTHDTRRFEPFPIYGTHAEGGRKWDVDGNEYVDFRMGHGALLLGHAHSAIVKAVAEQVAKGTHWSLSHELEIRWGSLVQQLIPCAEKLRFHSSGTEATLMAFRMARAYTGKSKILKFEDHFHGWQDYAMAGAGRAAAGIPEATWSTMVVVPPNDISQVKKVLASDNDVAAVVLEPTGAHMGKLPVYPSFVKQLREVTERYGVLLIFDEVVTGFRTSPGGAQARLGVTPDLCSLAKILAGGLPGGAVAGRGEIIDMIAFRGDPEWDSHKRIAHSGTFNANPLSAAAGATALEIIATQPVVARAEAMARRLKDGLNQLLAQMEIPGCVHGVASLIQLVIGQSCDCDREVCTMSHADIKKNQSGAFDRTLGQALLNVGVHHEGTFIVSSAHQEQDIDFTVGAFEEALSATRTEGALKV